MGRATLKWAIVGMAMAAGVWAALPAAAAPTPIFIDSNVGNPTSQCTAFSDYIGFDLIPVASIEDPPGSGGGVSVSGPPDDISWTSSTVIHAAFVKASTGGHLYLYPSGAFADSGLTSPRSSTSHVTFCTAATPPPAATPTATATPTETPTPVPPTPTHTPTPIPEAPTPKPTEKPSPTAKVEPTATPKPSPSPEVIPTVEQSTPTEVPATPTSTPTPDSGTSPDSETAPSPTPPPPTPTVTIVVLPDTRVEPAPTATPAKFVVPGLPTPTPTAEVLGQITRREDSGALAITGFAGLTLAFAGVALVAAGFLFLAKRRSLES